MSKKNYWKLVGVGFVFWMNIGFGQIDPNEYQTARDIIEEGKDLYREKKYDEAFLVFKKVNYNDTAYFDSRRKAVECAAVQHKYDTVINLCNEVLAVRKYNPFKEGFVNSVGHAMIQQDKFQEALDYFTEKLKEFPRSYLLRYNRSTALYELEKYSEAVEELQMSIRYNPRYYASHVKLGAICAEAGDITKAALALNMGLMLNASEEKSINIIAALQAMYAGNIEKNIGKIKYREEEDFDEIDLMLKNKVAENKKYKVKVGLKYNFIKHNHLLFETMKYDANSNGFWNQNYVRLFKEFMNKGQFANFSYFQSLSIEDENTQNVIAKNKTKITSFIEWGFDLFAKYMNERKVWNGKEYEPNRLSHYGEYGFNEDVKTLNGKKIGSYVSFNAYGLPDTKGMINQNEKIHGLWEYYNDNGQLVTTAMFTDGELEGKRTSYYNNGSRNQEMEIKNRNVVGDVLSYYSCNQLYSKIPFNLEGNKDGIVEYYYKTGGLSHKISYANGELNGEYLEYYSNGKLKAEYNYINGKIEGAYKAYHKNGAERIIGQYENNLETGHWKFTHANGQLKEEGELKSGYRIGEWKTFSENGKLYEETNYGETGKKTGIYKSYDLDEKLDIELVYKGEEIVSFKTYNNKGNIISQGEKKKKELEFIDYYDNKKPRVKGNYYKGKTVGKWYYYNQYGVLKKELNYNEEGKLEDTSKWYFDNGQLETIKVFKNDIVNGYFVDYYRNGIIFKHGWLLDGVPVGEWQYFYRNGALRTSEYYLEGEVHGDVLYYDEKERILEISQYFYGTLENIISFDSTGKEIAQYPLVNGAAKFDFKDANGKVTVSKEYVGAESNGTRTDYFTNGNIKSKGEIVNGNYEGEWKWYFKDGELRSEGRYDEGNREGEWKWYNKKGQLKVVEKYHNGNREGTWIRYYDNGKIETERNYRNDEKHGKSTYYDETGVVQYIRYYDDGLMLGYSYLGKDGKPVEMIPFDNQNGTMEAYFPSGLKSYHSEYKDGFNQGKTVYYHANGKEADVRNYDKNQYHGTLTEYYKNGQVKNEGEYVFGDLYGTYKEYYENGKIKVVENYILGELYGWAEYYKENEDVPEKVFYYNGLQLN